VLLRVAPVEATGLAVEPPVSFLVEFPWLKVFLQVVRQLENPSGKVIFGGDRWRAEENSGVRIDGDGRRGVSMKKWLC